MTLRNPRGLIALFLFCLYLAVPAAAQLTGGGLTSEDRTEVPYLSIEPSKTTIEAGASVVITVQFNSSSSGLEDYLQWSTDSGQLTPMLITLPNSERMLYTAPEEPGIYTVRAISAFNPQHFVETTIVVYGEERLVLDSDTSLVLTGPMDTASIEVLYIASNGKVSKVKELDWTSSRPTVIGVNSAGKVTAWDEEGSAVLTGTKGELGPVVVTASIATLKPDTVMLPSNAVRYLNGDQVMVNASYLSDSLEIGQVLVSSHGLGFLGHVTALQWFGSDLLVSFEPAGLPDAFSTLQVDVRTPVVSVHQIIKGEETADGTSEKAGVEPFCETTSGDGTLLFFHPGDVDHTVDIYVGSTYDLREGQPPRMEFWVGGDTGVTIKNTDITVSTLVGITIECGLKLPTIPLPATALGPLGLTLNLTPRLGAFFFANVAGDLIFRAPDLTRSVTNIRQGFGFNGEGFYLINERTHSGLQSSYPEGTEPFGASTHFKAELMPYLSAYLGVGATNINLDVLELRLFGYGRVTVEPPLSPNEQDYTGPGWRTGVGALASFKPLLDNILIQQLFRLFGIDHDFKLNIIFEKRHDLLTSPELSLATVLDDPNNPTEVTLTVTAVGAEGGDAHFLAWPYDNPSGSPSQLGPNVVVNASGQASVTVAWPDEKKDVAARVAHGTFGTVGWPYGKAKVTIGGNAGGDCDGPECPPTTPGGPPGGSGGPGGGFGDSGDDGSSGYPGSVGGGGIGGNGNGGPGGGPGGGVGDGSGNNVGSSGSTGDPHIISLDGLRYNFQGAGEFILVGTTDAGGAFDPHGDLQIQVRQRQVQPGLQGAINTAVAVRMGTDTVAIYADPQLGQSTLYVNGVAASDPGSTPLALEAGGVYGGGNAYTLVWLDGSRLRVNPGYQHLDLSIFLADARLGQTVGLMGVYDGDRANDFTTRDGTVLDPPINFYQLYDLLGESWRVPAGAQLLDPAIGGGDPTDPNFPESFPPPTIPDEILDEAELRCEQAGVYVPDEVYGQGTTETFPAGRFGFYNLSQAGVTYGNFVVSGL